jgi:peroxiredoxin
MAISNVGSSDGYVGKTELLMPRLFLIALLVLLAGRGLTLAADDPTTFEVILAAEQRRTFERITQYVAEHPDAADAFAARQWLLMAAQENGLEADAVGHADAVLAEPMVMEPLRTLAQQVRIIGLAKAEKSDEAVQEFAGLLRFARLSSGGPMIDFGRQFATQLRMARDFDAAREVYSQIANRFFLNSDVRGVCDNLTAKIDLVDQPAPDINVPDTAGETVDLSTLSGKVVLIDFWATNCPPCIEELPNLRELYSRHHERGFEIIGVSLDGDVSVVEAFAQRQQMPWRQIVSESDVAALREKYLVRTIPTLMIIGPDGKVAQFEAATCSRQSRSCCRASS